MQVAQVHIQEEQKKHLGLLEKIKELEDALKTKSSPPPPEPKGDTEMADLLKQTLAKVGELETKLNKPATERDENMKHKGSLHGKRAPPPPSEASAPSDDDKSDGEPDEDDEDWITTPNGARVTLLHIKVQWISM